MSSRSAIGHSTSSERALNLALSTSRMRRDARPIMLRLTQAAAESTSTGPSGVSPLAPMNALSAWKRLRKAVVSGPNTPPSRGL